MAPWAVVLQPSVLDQLSKIWEEDSNLKLAILFREGSGKLSSQPHLAPLHPLIGVSAGICKLHRALRKTPSDSDNPT